MRGALEQQVARSGQDPAVGRAGIGHFPALGSGHRIERDERAGHRRHGSRAHCLVGGNDPAGDIQAQLEAGRTWLPVRIGRVILRRIVDRDINQPGLGAEAHRGPAVRADRAGEAKERLAGDLIACLRIDLGRAGDRIEPGGPVDPLHKRFAREELAGLGIKRVEKSVLWRVHDDMLLGAVQIEIGDDDLLVGIEIPAIFRGFLEMPGICPGIGVHRDDRGGVEAVPGGCARSRSAAFGGVPWLSIGGAEVDQVGGRVIGDPVPHRAAAAGFPGILVPGLGGGFEMFAFERLGWIAGDGEELPLFCAGLRVIGCQITAAEVFRTGRTDQHHAFGDAGRAGDGLVRAFGNGQL